MKEKEKLPCEVDKTTQLSVNAQKNTLAPQAEPGQKTPTFLDKAREPGPEGVKVMHRLADVNVRTDNKKRSTGLRIFDVLLYPFFTNFVVFGISVGATYLTSKGGDRDASGKLIFGKVGEFFQKRGDWMMNKFQKAGMNSEQADMAKMVFFSFADGTLVAPAVKLLEDRRESIACSIDNALGTTPDDKSVYKAEPKQGWLSVIGGRLATCSIVVPTAVVLDKTGLNTVLFRNPGHKTGEWIAKNSTIAKHLTKYDIPELSKIGFFEAFYTSVCTGGIYVCSRALATFMGKKPKKDASAPANEESAPATVASSTEEKPATLTSTKAATSRITPGGIAKALAKAPAAQFVDLAEHTGGMERA